MSPAMLLTVALFVAGIGLSVLAYWVRRNDATTAEVLEAVQTLNTTVATIQHTVFGPQGDNGLNGDNRDTKRIVGRLTTFVQGACFYFGVSMSDDGTLSVRDGESPFERRFAERRHGSGRRLGDA